MLCRQVILKHHLKQGVDRFLLSSHHPGLTNINANTQDRQVILDARMSNTKSTTTTPEDRSSMLDLEQAFVLLDLDLPLVPLCLALVPRSQELARLYLDLVLQLLAHLPLVHLLLALHKFTLCSEVR